ncbi:DNA-binding SARP family transcriptional activator [Lentzea atacamensis]|uniref:DNA-binding SARP family transcriptional activator n=1 Tax=Lentzea atacamensis TaxID=531938 RepID=A0A316HSN2_9PSEU|nr:BTAD domain-containing putative transcriptional regulator [Lentzea atacamensis]PWK83613.1 DNA-binding SARP family transcriptional activator [Lentzea atacamensis]
MTKVEFRLLGDVALFVDGRAIDLGPARQRCVLAALALDVNRVVSVDRLTDRVWGEQPPRRARATLINYLSRLRQLLGDTGADVVRRSGGYTLAADQSSVDVHVFHDLCERARGEADDHHQAAKLLEDALGLWHGEALTGLGGEWAAAERDRLHQQRVTAECDLVDALLRLGRGEELVSELSTRVTAFPLDERVAGQYMLALYRAGRSAAALEHYRRIRTRLVDDLGTDPGVALQQLHKRILDADPTLTAPPHVERAGRAVVPRQLPAAPRSFTGRASELAALDSAVADSGEGDRTVVISALAGAGGIGKTALALHWAHRHVDRVPDGQLFVDLQGFSPAAKPVEPATALRRFLDALGVDPGAVPSDPQARAGLFRSMVAGRRMLIVLDNANDTTQVLPLLPGTPTCTVLITSRNHLTGLVTLHGAHHLPIDVISDTEARALLTSRLGAERVGAAPDAVAELLACCGGFPLALSIVAGRAQLQPGLPLARLAAELRGVSLDALEQDDPFANLPAVLSWSYHALPADQARAFGLLGIAPGPDISVEATANLTGLPAGRAEAVLRGLEQASLISQDSRGRYRMHDLIRRYAADRAAGELPEAERESALRRVVDFYLHTAHAGDRILTPHREPVPIDPPVSGCVPRPLDDDIATLEWFAAEHTNLLAAQLLAGERGWYSAVCQLASVLSTFHRRKGNLHDDLVMWRAALAAADRLGDPAAQARANRLLGHAYTLANQPAEAARHHQHALTLAEQTGDAHAQAHTHHALAGAWTQQGDHQQALEHATHALQLYRALGVSVREADMLNAMGWCHTRLGSYEQARIHCEEAVALARRHQYRDGEANTLDTLGYVDHVTGRHSQAVAHYRQALALYREFGHSYYEANTLDHLGQTQHECGDHDQARHNWNQALRLYQTQHRTTEAERVRQQLNALNQHQGDNSPGDDASRP